MLQKILISNKSCSFEHSKYQRILKKNGSGFSRNTYNNEKCFLRRK